MTKFDKLIKNYTEGQINVNEILEFIGDKSNAKMERKAIKELYSKTIKSAKKSEEKLIAAKNYNTVMDVIRLIDKVHGDKNEKDLIDAVAGITTGLHIQSYEISYSDMISKLELVAKTLKKSDVKPMDILPKYNMRTIDICRRIKFMVDTASVRIAAAGLINKANLVKVRVVARRGGSIKLNVDFKRIAQVEELLSYVSRIVLKNAAKQNNANETKVQAASMYGKRGELVTGGVESRTKGLGVKNTGGSAAPGVIACKAVSDSCLNTPLKKVTFDDVSETIKESLPKKKKKDSHKVKDHKKKSNKKKCNGTKCEKETCKCDSRIKTRSIESKYGKLPEKKKSVVYREASTELEKFLGNVLSEHGFNGNIEVVNIDDLIGRMK